MFIALVGPDGSGKTTVAHALEQNASEAGMEFWYQHWVPNSTNPPVPYVTQGGAVPPKVRPRDAASLLDQCVSVLRLGRNLGRFWLGYLRLVRPLRRTDNVLVVADRWIYNYIGQPYSVAYRGPIWLARLAMQCAPRPDLIAVLDAPGDVVAARKPELTPEEAALEATRWRHISGRWWPAEVIDATRRPEQVAADIMAAAAGIPRGRKP